MTRPFFLLCYSTLLLLSAVGGCTGKEAPAGSTTVPEVTVTPAVEQEVVDSAEFPGRTEATASVEIRARVTGYLEKIAFRSGAEVKKGELLFEIDPLPYKAELERAEGQVALQQARLERLNRDYERNRPLVGKGAISAQEFDKIVGDRQEAEGALKAATANVKTYQLDLQFATIKAPIDGKISRNQITEGNLVKADQTVLATLVATGQMYAYFDVDENSLLRYEAQVRRQKTKPEERPHLAELTRGDGTVMTGGAVDYVDVQLARTTGTLQVRALFPDKDGILKGGQFVRVRLPLGDPHKALVVPEVAVGSDQGLKYVYVVDDQNKVAYRRVKTGDVHGGMQVIEDGLKAGELVIVKGLLRVRDGVTVKPTRENAKS